MKSKNAIIKDYEKDKQKELKDNPLTKLRHGIFKKISTKYKLKDGMAPGIYGLFIPTGYGKTLLSLYLASCTYKRIIYIFPYRAIIEQTHKTMKEIFPEDKEKITVFHSSHRTPKDTNEDTYNKESFLSNIFDADIVLTTIDQLFLGLFGPSTKHIAKFKNLSDSVIIMDEIQTIPLDLWHDFIQFLEFFSKQYKVPIILMTGTNPLPKNYKLKLIDVGKVSSPNRYTLKYIPKPFNPLEWKKELENNKKSMIVVNRVRDIQKFYDKIKGVKKPVYCLTSQTFPPINRRRIIDKINEKEEWIIITTQGIEAGVDIDADIAFRSLAPFDCIIQLCGRVNRNNRIDNGKIFVFDDYHGIYGKEKIQITKDILEKNPEIQEKDNLKFLKKYFEAMNKVPPKSLLFELCSFTNIQIRELLDKFEKGEKVEIFLTLDDKSKGLFEELHKLKEELEGKKGFTKEHFRYKLIEQKAREYCIQISKNKLDDELIYRLDENNRLFLNKKDTEKYYDKTTGFKVKEND